jgi:hypothetical protein
MVQLTSRKNNHRSHPLLRVTAILASVCAICFLAHFIASAGSLLPHPGRIIDFRHGTTRVDKHQTNELPIPVFYVENLVLRQQILAPVIEVSVYLPVFFLSYALDDGLWWPIVVVCRHASAVTPGIGGGWPSSLAIRRRFWAGNRQQELIPCTTYPAQPQLIQFQDPLEMRKQHLDFSRSLQAGEEVEVIIHVSSCPEFDCNDGAGQSARTLKSFFGVVFPTW